MDDPNHPNPSQELPPPPEEKLLNAGSASAPALAVPPSSFWKKYGWIHWLLFFLLILEVIVGAYILSGNQTNNYVTPYPTPAAEKAAKPSPQTNVICTADAFQCPDGSYVGRTGPKCEFVCK